MTTMALLERCELLAGLHEEQVQILTNLAAPLEVEEGTLLFREGDSAKFLYVIGEGKVALEMVVSKPNGGHTHPATVATLGPGEAFGWSAIVDPYVLTMSARAAGPCQLVRLDGVALREVLRSYQGIGFVFMSNLTRLLAGRLARTRETLIYERGWAMV